MSDHVDNLAKKLLAYMCMDMPVVKSEVIIGMGASDTRVAERAAQLFLNAYGEIIIFTGGLGKITKHTQTQTEAEKFQDIALRLGVPKTKILLEKKTTNVGENIVFVQKLLDEHGLAPKSILVVTKPYMERRAYAAYKKLWRDKQTAITVTSPQITYDEYFSDNVPKDVFLNVMVGDLQRIKEYPKQGFQIEQKIPKDVWDAYEELVRLGYTKQVMNATQKNSTTRQQI